MARITQMDLSAFRAFAMVKRVHPRYDHLQLVAHHVKVLRFPITETEWDGLTKLSYFLLFGTSIRPLRTLDLTDGFCHYPMQTGDAIVRTGYVRGKDAVAHLYLPAFHGEPINVTHIVHADGSVLRDMRTA